MSTLELRRRVKRDVDALNERELQSVADFVQFVRASAATGARLAAATRFRRRLKSALADERDGRLVRATDLRVR